MAIEAVFALLATPVDEIAIFQSLKEGREKEMAALTGQNMAGYSTSGGTRQGQGANGHKGMVPFVRASAEHSESVGYDVTTTMTASVQSLPDIVIPAYGFLRSVLLVVTTSTAGVGTTVVPTEDAPFNVLSNIVLQEPNGAQICNFPSGYDLYLANKYGGYRYCNDARMSPNFDSNLVNTEAVAGFVLRIPVEINNRDALGSLPNQNSGALFRVKLNLNTIANVWSSATMTTDPIIRVRAFAEAWDQPEDITDGIPNQTTPPALNTTQYWSRQDFAVNAGVANIRLTRMGNYIRNLIFIYRDDATPPDRSAADANFPDPLTVYYDTRPLDTISRAQWLERIMERYGYIIELGRNNTTAGQSVPVDSGGGRESNVWPLDFCHEFDGQVGHENRSLWLPTWSSTRFEVGGDWGEAGTLTVLTNDVTVADNVYAAGV